MQEHEGKHVSALTFPFTLHYVSHSGGAHQHHEIHDLAELQQTLMRLPRLSLLDAEGVAERVLMGETVDLGSFGLDAVVWPTSD